MEPIDRIAFMKDLTEKTEAYKDLCKDDIQYLKVVMVMNGFFRDLKEYPTVEVDSRPKGEWIETDLDCGKRHIRCNQCWYADCEIPKEKIKDMDYCPQCGAEMR